MPREFFLVGKFMSIPKILRDDRVYFKEGKIWTYEHVNGCVSK